MRRLTAVSPRLGAWAQAAAEQTRAALAAIGADELPITVLHGDFAEWNVHYQNGRLAGVIDFGLAHQDSRPYELAMARTYRAPETADAYRAELAQQRLAAERTRGGSDQAGLLRVPPRHGRLGTRPRAADRRVRPHRDRTLPVQDRHPALALSSPAGKTRFPDHAVLLLTTAIQLPSGSVT